MTLAYAVILAVIQGITEFLPISSSGHLAIVQHLMRFEEPPIAYDLLLHFATQAGVLVYFWPRIKVLFVRVFKGKEFKLIIPLVLVSLPIAVLGIFAGDLIESAFSNLAFVGLAYLLTSGLLLSTHFLDNSQLSGRWTAQKPWKAFVIGVFQSAAALPGVSRAGTTIVGGMYAGLKPKEAFEFSFFAGLISVTGASIVSLFTERASVSFSLEEVVGAVVAAVVGYLSITLLAKILKSGKFWLFGIYCLLLSGLSFFLFLN